MFDDKSTYMEVVFSMIGLNYQFLKENHPYEAEGMVFNAVDVLGNTFSTKYKA